MPQRTTTPPPKYQLKQFTPKTIASSRKEWMKLAGDDEFATEYGFVFEWAEDHIDYTNGKNDSLAYGIFSPRSSKAVAIVEVIQRSQARKGLTKMLKLWITPALWDTSTSQNRDRIARITIAAMQGTIQLSKQNQSKTVKIYGRTDQMLSILYTVHTMFSEMITRGQLPGVEVNIIDRWLEFKLADSRGAK